MYKFRLIAVVFLFLSALSLVSAAHFIEGVVNDAFDGTEANNYEITLWNPDNGVADNLTDIIGPNGNSNTDNSYLINCELLASPCQIGDEINVKIFNNGSNYITKTANLTVTGADFDTMPNLTLNSPPNASLLSPQNHANFSQSEINLSCRVSDFDGNLANTTLYGNWKNGWHANETILTSGSENIVNFTKDLQDGIYKWNCLATDNLSIAQFAEQNFTFTIDTTAPNVNSIELNLSGDVCGLNNYVEVNCTANDGLTGIDSVWIEATTPSGKINYTTQFLGENTYFTDIAPDEIGLWSFNCIANDSVGNLANLTSAENINVHSDLADLTISPEDISFSNTNPIEDFPLLINATIYNTGCGNADNFIVSFFEDDPDSEGNQINGNQTISLTGLNNLTVNVTWFAKVGITNIFVYADFNNTITEENESNNKANKTITVGAWQEFYGDITIDKLLGDKTGGNLSLWLNESLLEGNVFFVDSESEVSWSNLQAIGKNTSGSNTTNDFSEIDELLNMDNFPDSVSNKFTSDGDSPISTNNFLIHQQNIENVPTINSTNNTNFVTGILWDMSDDSDGEFDKSEKEDLIFVTKLNKSGQGAYGICDYEITIPVRLREYHTADTKEIFIYFDLN